MGWVKFSNLRQVLGPYFNNVRILVLNTASIIATVGYLKVFLRQPVVLTVVGILDVLE